MTARLASGALLACWALLAQQGTQAKQKPANYPVHSQAGEIGLGAEYLVHSFSGGGNTFIAPDYLVIEVALFPPPGQALSVASEQFTLRMNAKKAILYPQAPGMVAASLKYPDWEMRPGVETSVGLGDAGVVIGRPRTVGRFPGDRRDPTTRAPQQPKVPPQTPAGVEKQPAMTAAEVAADAALPAGEFRGPVSGYVYFHYQGKTTSIRSLELIWRHGAGSITLPLF